nr:MAG: tetratricopeptide repeat protein [Hyphomicrobiales bacterium]
MTEQLMQEAQALHESGQLDAAAEIYLKVIEAEPRQFLAQCSLGFVYMLQSRFADAEKHLAASISVEPRIPDAWAQLSVALHQQGRAQEAVSCLDRAIGLQPDNVEMLTNRAVILLDLGCIEQAQATIETALAFKPDFVHAHIIKGNVFAAQKNYEKALMAYDAALAGDPDNPVARENREHTLFSLGRTPRCTPTYMRRLFDAFTDNYDRHMLETLDYRAHLQLRDLANKIPMDKKSALSILDLGSGTGLVGETFKDLAHGGRLRGIDLSPLMNEEAKKRGIYDELILGDLEPYLASPGLPYDLILAADTLIYLGDLAPTFGGAAQRLVPGGHFVFAVEAKGEEGWTKTDANRFAHSLSYLRDEAKRQGLEFVEFSDQILRTQDKIPVEGYVVALRKPA